MSFALPPQIPRTAMEQGIDSAMNAIKEAISENKLTREKLDTLIVSKKILETALSEGPYSATPENKELINKSIALIKTAEEHLTKVTSTASRVSSAAASVAHTQKKAKSS